MNNPHPNQGHLERNSHEVVKLLRAGVSGAEVARRFHVTQQAASKFVKRHRRELVSS
jgi:hypothetical protein